MANKAFDYSKWDNIELSDDESDLHPNIDKVLHYLTSTIINDNLALAEISNLSFCLDNLVD